MILKWLNFKVTGARANRTLQAAGSNSAYVMFSLVLRGVQVLELVGTNEAICGPASSLAQAEDVRLLHEVRMRISQRSEAIGDRPTFGQLSCWPSVNDGESDGLIFHVELSPEYWEEIWSATISQIPPTSFQFGFDTDNMEYAGSDYYHLQWDNRALERLELWEVSWDFETGSTD